MGRSSETSFDKIAGLLERWRQGDAGAFDALFPLVYDELRSLAGSYLARERIDHTLEATALVHEAYLRLAGLGRFDARDRTHFFAVAARAMRRILVDHARRHEADKRPGAVGKLPLLESHLSPLETPVELLRLDAALNELETTHPRAALIIEQRFFGGLSEQDVADVSGISRATVSREWRFARLWLHDALK